MADKQIEDYLLITPPVSVLLLLLPTPGLLLLTLQLFSPISELLSLSNLSFILV